MTQVKKIWYFVEGYAELNFVEQMFRRCFFDFVIYRDKTQFLNGQRPGYHIERPLGEGSLPFAVFKEYHWIINSNAESPFIICDTESFTLCPINKRMQIINKISALNNQEKVRKNIEEDKIKLVCSIPTIEEIYCFEEALTLKVLFSYTKQEQPNFPKNWKDLSKSPKTRIEKLFESNQQRYDKREFSEKFFSQLDYENSKNPTVARLLTLTKNILK